jgi:HSP20 family protein
MVRKKRDGEIVPQTGTSRPMSLFSELDRMFEDMDSWFWGPSFALTPRMANDRLRSPRVNVQDAGDKYVLTAEMPGVSKKNLELHIRDNVLEISAKEEMEINEENEEAGYIYREMRSNSFHRQIPLGQDIIPEESDAELKDGMLTVNLKKMDENNNIHTIAVK